MKFVLREGKNCEFEESVEINTIEDLITLMESYNCPIILEWNDMRNEALGDKEEWDKYNYFNLNRDLNIECKYELLLYNDYIE